MPQYARLKASTKVMYDELVKQGMETRIVDADSSILEYIDSDGQSRLLFSTSSSKSSSVGAMIAADKLQTGLIAKELGIAVPEDTVCNSLTDALQFFERHSIVVLKPVSGYGGRGVSTDVRDAEALRMAYDYASKSGPRVIAQQHVRGSDFRLLVVAGDFQSAVERRPASIIGDGVSTIESLIDEENVSATRTNNYTSLMSMIDKDGARRFLANNMANIPADGTVVQVVGPANLSLGGSIHEATHLVTQQMITEAEKIVCKLGLGICGVDMMLDQETGVHYLIEVNATPRVDMHNDPFWGTSSDAIERYVKWLRDANKWMNA